MLDGGVGSLPTFVKNQTEQGRSQVQERNDCIGYRDALC